MANTWFRLWHDMPTDPKFRVIARESGQSIGNVLGVYLHILADASANANERGRTESLHAESVAIALEMEIEDVIHIIKCMQGRVLDGDRVTGWEKRQPAREDGSAERARQWREAKRQEKEASERKRTQTNANERSDKDKDTDNIKRNSKALEQLALLMQNDVPEQLAKDWLAIRKEKRAPLTVTAMEGTIREAGIAGMTLVQAITYACEKGWAGFKASYIQQDRQQKPQYQSAADKQREQAQRMFGELTNGRRREIDISQDGAERDRQVVPFAIDDIR